MPVPLDTLLAAAPYLAGLNARHGGWLAAALTAPDAALSRELLGRGWNRAHRRPRKPRSPPRSATPRAAWRCSPQPPKPAASGPRPQSTAALSDLADAALEAGLEFLLRKAADKGDVRPEITAATSGLTIFALGKHGGRELNYSSDIDIVAFFDRAGRRADRSRRGHQDLLPHRAAARRADAGPDRRRLCVPHRPAAAARSGLDAGRASRSMPRSPTTRVARPELGARRLDQGAALRRRQGGGRGVPRASWRPMSGASISTSRPSPTSRR